MFAQFPILYLATSIVIGLFTLLITKPISSKIGLVDYPNHRKLHTEITPLTGGISVFVAVFINLLLIGEINTILVSYLISVSIIFVLGVFDDIYDLSSGLRFIVQLVVGFSLCYFSNIQIENLGDLFALGDVNLGVFSYVFTTLVIVATINAFNMLDGADGLLGSVSLIAFFSLGFIYYMKGDSLLTTYSLILFSSVIPFFLCNIGIIEKYKIFLGDSGSMIIGLSIIWLLMLGTRGETHHFSSTTALWIVALPFMDMLRVIFTRKLNKKSMFKADRSHLHHVLQGTSLSQQTSIFIIAVLSLVLSFTGIIFDYFQVPLSLSLMVFFIAFYFYVRVINSLIK